MLIGTQVNCRDVAKEYSLIADVSQDGSKMIEFRYNLPIKFQEWIIYCEDRSNKYGLIAKGICFYNCISVIKSHHAIYK